MKRLSNILIISLLSGLLNVNCNDSPTSSEQPLRYRIAFRVSNHIMLMNEDGSEQRKLTSLNAFEGNERWSPDGSRIGFSSDASGDFEIYAVNTDGTNLTRLTDHPGFSSGDLCWSPDGSKIAYTSNHEGDVNIYTMDSNSSNQQRLIERSPDDSTPAFELEWSPDGTRMKFAGGLPPQIHIVNSDGTELKRITDWEYGAGPSRWSPDGSEIAVAPFLGDVYVMNADGSGMQRLTNIGFRTIRGFLDWSPDGSKIGFGSVHEDHHNIYLLSADGSDIERLTNSFFRFFSNPSWSPDGSQIAFSAYDDELGRYQIYLMASDGTGMEQLTSPYSCHEPIWSPAPF
jgi:Tol biopolymer transport system component